MSTFTSGSGSASARGADAGVSVLETGKELEAADCCHLSASQVDILARAQFLGGGGSAGEEEEEAEVFSTPPLTQQDPQRQGQSLRGQAGEVPEGEDGIVICSMLFTQTQSSSTSSASSSPPSDSWERKPRKPRICTRKVRAGAMIRTPTPTLSPSPSPELDPLVRIVLMIPTAPLPTTGHEDILELARSRGIF